MGLNRLFCFVCCVACYEITHCCLYSRMDRRIEKDAHGRILENSKESIPVEAFSIHDF
jgi:hypothetical protein